MNLRQFYTGRAIGLLVLLVIIGLVAGFFKLNDYIYEEKQATSTPEVIVGENLDGEADPSRMTLDMTKWRWISAQYEDGRIVKPKTEGVFTLSFDKSGRFSASTDCNSMGGSYEATKTAITFTDMMSTLMYCEGSQEGVFAELLRDTAGYHFTSRGELILSLKYDSGTVTFR